MARADRRRSGRSPAPARPRSEYAAIEDQLFFSRLRTHAKIGFVILAFFMLVGFVAFGVGSDVPGGIADVLQGSSATNEISVEEARERVAREPNNAEALRELSAALVREGRTDGAIRALERYVRVSPEDEAAQRELASLYVAKATRLRNEAVQAQAEGQLLAPAALFRPASDAPLGQLAGGSPIRETIEQEAQQKLTEAYLAMQEAYRDAQRAYQRLARLTPQDAQVQVELANAAVNAGELQTAVRAYRRFLALAPEDPLAPDVRREVRRLERELERGGR
ncbi:MAG: tetratricopeptide repeat protein [Thermoleophilia bacterium]|nr:tetratricopeptide repeat protein [Thermoleophilia bacterium]